MSAAKIEQSVENFKKALAGLSLAIQKPALSDLELAGAIQHFEFSFELAWKTLKKLGESKGRRIATPREAFAYAFEAGLITDDNQWIAMIQDRNETVHTYNKPTADNIFALVKKTYFPILADLCAKLDALKEF